MNEVKALKSGDWKVLYDLENIIGKSIPQIEQVKRNSLGFVFRGDNIIGLGLFNCLATFPDCITSLKSLKELYLEGNELTTLPESIGNLKSLQALDLGNNTLRVLPESISKLKSLQKLILKGNKLYIFPEPITRLKRLKELDLTSNELINLPDSIMKLKSLQKLILDGNNLTSLPDSIGELSLLKELSLINNGLETLPESFKFLSFLQKLNLSYNQLSIFPESICYLTSLRDLCLLKNQLKELPKSIENLKSLQKLDLRYNDFSLLPDSIGNLNSLKEIDLRYNQLYLLPESIGDLLALKYLYLDNNQLNVIPISITNLKSLEVLCLGSNYLSFLPESIDKLILLQELDLTSNKLTYLPESIGNLPSLKYLYLDHNYLATLPESICNLKTLESLCLNGNQLISLPKSMEKLKFLQEIDLKGNKLRILPKSLRSLPIIQNISIDKYQKNRIKYITRQISAAKKDLNKFKEGLSDFIIEKLEEYYKDDWWDKGLPSDIRFYIENKIETISAESSQLKSQFKEALELNHYFSIISKEDNWQNIFSNVFHDKEALGNNLDKLTTFKAYLKKKVETPDDLYTYYFNLYDILKFFSNSFNIYLSYDVDDMEYYQIPEIVNHLEAYPKINKVFFWNIDNSGGIISDTQGFMNISKIYILFFSQNSFNSSRVTEEWNTIFQLNEESKINIISIYENQKNIPHLLNEMLRVKFNKENFDGFLDALYKKVIDAEELMNIQVSA
ncbi:MAG: toll/interleukin-1 receptor domain-containing protein [Candidatus Hodarchaeota archaeon]